MIEHFSTSYIDSKWNLTGSCETNSPTQIRVGSMVKNFNQLSTISWLVKGVFEKSSWKIKYRSMMLLMNMYNIDDKRVQNWCDIQYSDRWQTCIMLLIKTNNTGDKHIRAVLLKKNPIILINMYHTVDKRIQYCW
jgi:hypothetical protein